MAVVRKGHILILSMLILGMSFLCSAGVFAAEEGEGEIIAVPTEEEFIQSIETPEDTGEILVDKETGQVGGEPFEEVFGTELEDVEDIPQAVADTGFFAVTSESEDEYVAMPLYEGKQILVEEEVGSLYGADRGVTYDGDTVLTFSDAETTRAAYEELVAEYGEDKVLVDMPVHMEEKEWGSEYMNMTSKVRRTRDAGINTKVIVAVIDSGIQKTHRAFKGKTILRSSKSYVDNNLSDTNGHGTAVAGIIAESTPNNVRLMVIKVLRKNGTGSLLKMLSAIDYAAENGADVINLSLGVDLGPAYAGYVNRRLADIVKKYNVVMVSSVGNEGNYSPNAYPAASPSVISVGSIRKDGKVSSFSNYANHVEFCAPGEKVACAKKGTTSGYVVKSGTSLSAPYISASCCLIKMVNRSLNQTRVRSHLKLIAVDGGKKGRDRYYGWGKPRFKLYKKKITQSMVTVKNVQYKGKKVTPKIIVKDGGRVIKSYKVVYPEGRTAIGTHLVRIVGKNGYTGTVTRTFKIVPRRPGIKARSGKRSVRVSWSKTARGYQVQVWKTRGKKARPFRSCKVRGKTYKWVLGLQSNKRYWVRVRGYVKKGSKVYYSPWSKWVRPYAR